MGSAASIDAPKVRQAQLARDLGVSRQSINELVKRGVLVSDAAGLIDVALARLALAERLHPSAKTSVAITADAPTTPQPAISIPAAPQALSAGEDGAETVTSYHVAKTLREIAEARLAELKLAEQRGLLVQISDVRAEMAKRFGQIRTNLLQIPARMSPLIAIEEDAARIHAMLDAEIRTILGNVAAAD